MANIPELALSEEEWAEIARARFQPTTFDEDCPERALRFRRVNPVRKSAN